MAPGVKPSARFKSKPGAIGRLKIPSSLSFNVRPDGPVTSRSNRFSALADQSDMEVNYESNIASSERPPKPPPIVVDSSSSFREVQHLLGADCTYKRTSIGIKVFPLNSEKHEFCKTALKENKIEFHTFNPKENRLFTVFLYGLPRIKCEEIITDLKGYNLTPASVTEVNTRFSSADDAVYKVQFTRKLFNPSSLRNIKSICNVIVTWKKHQPKKNEKPTQCWNCLMYGHGGEHCNRKSACMICANQHHTKDCPFNKNDKRPVAFSCFNCKKNGEERTDHSANDVNCPLRTIYLEARARASSYNQHKRSVPRRQNSYVNNLADYPTLNKTNTRNVINQRVNERSYAEQIKSNTNDLFSVDELFDIFTSALDELSKCTSKVQQIQVVMSMVKYAYDFK